MIQHRNTPSATPAPLHTPWAPSSAARRGSLILSLTALPLLVLATTGCPEKAAPAAKPCCEQPTIPAGMVPFKVVKDAVVGNSDEANVTIAVALAKPATRAELYPVLHLLYRHAMTRTAFEPINFSAEVYPDEAAASAGSGAVGKIERPQGKAAPDCENRIANTFEETAAITFGVLFQRKPEEDTSDTCRMAEQKAEKAPDEGFTHRPSMKVDAAARAIEITYPFLELGKDEFQPGLRYTSACKQWIDYTTALFRKIPDLKSLTFSGVHTDGEVLRIVVSKEQFETNFAGLQEDIAAHAALTFQKLGMNATNEKAALKEQEEFYMKTYKGALATLPKTQVTVAKTLK